MPALLLVLFLLASCTPSPAAHLETRRLAITGSGCAFWVSEGGRPVALQHRHAASCPRTWGGGW